MNGYQKAQTGIEWLAFFSIITGFVSILLVATGVI